MTALPRPSPGATVTAEHEDHPERASFLVKAFRRLAIPPIVLAVLGQKRDDKRNTPMSKVSENLLRRVARRRGYGLAKSRDRDPAAQHYGMYQLTNIDTGEVYVDTASGGAWMTGPALARSLDREDVATNHHGGQVGEPEQVIPVVALKLVPKLEEEQAEDTWVVESMDDSGITATLALSDEKARDLAEKILAVLDSRQQGEAEA